MSLSDESILRRLVLKCKVLSDYYVDCEVLMGCRKTGMILTVHCTASFIAMQMFLVSLLSLEVTLPRKKTKRLHSIFLAHLDT